MNGSPHDVALFSIVVEGSVDFFCGRPRDKNPYCSTYARDCHEAWDWGWQDAEYLLGIRGRDEAARWLREVA